MLEERNRQLDTTLKQQMELYLDVVAKQQVAEERTLDHLYWMINILALTFGAALIGWLMRNRFFKWAEERINEKIQVTIDEKANDKIEELDEKLRSIPELERTLNLEIAKAQKTQKTIEQLSQRVAINPAVKQARNRSQNPLSAQLSLFQHRQQPKPHIHGGKEGDHRQGVHASHHLAPLFRPWKIKFFFSMLCQPSEIKVTFLIYYPSEIR